MAVTILTGYTGERHITPYMDATVNRSIFGDTSCILSTGSQMVATMPTINQFVIADGAFSIQGHVGITTGETLSVDTCATGNNRIDLVVARYTHDATTLVDSMSIVVVKGEETNSQYPTTPTTNTGNIASGASPVDMVLYKISLSGSTVTFAQVAPTMAPLLIDGSTDDDLVVVKGDESNVGFRATRTDTNKSGFFGIGSGGTNLGIWSNALNKYLIYENGSYVGIPHTDIRLAGHSSGIGTVKNAYLATNKTCASGTWYGLCNIQLEAGVWLLEAGARWNANSSGSRSANVSSTSGDNGQNVSLMAAGQNVTSARWSMILMPTATTRYYLNVNQASGTNLVCPASSNNTGNFLRAVRIL